MFSPHELIRPCDDRESPVVGVDHRRRWGRVRRSFAYLHRSTSGHHSGTRRARPGRVHRWCRYGTVDRFRGRIRDPPGGVRTPGHQPGRPHPNARDGAALHRDIDEGRASHLDGPGQVRVAGFLHQYTAAPSDRVRRHEPGGTATCPGPLSTSAECESPAVQARTSRPTGSATTAASTGSATSARHQHSVVAGQSSTGNRTKAADSRLTSIP